VTEDASHRLGNISTFLLPLLLPLFQKTKKEKGYPTFPSQKILKQTVKRNSVQYSCLQTMQVRSPQGDIVAPECCDQQRSGFIPKALPETIAKNGVHSLSDKKNGAG